MPFSLRAEGETWYFSPLRYAEISIHFVVAISCRQKKFERTMTKPHRKLKKANHGQRAANSKARKAKRKKVRT